MRSHVCVGGPKAGQQIGVRRGAAGFKVAQPCEDGKIAAFEYTEQLIADGAAVWAPAGQSLSRTLELLLEAYEQSCIIRRRS